MANGRLMLRCLSESINRCAEWSPFISFPSVYNSPPPFLLPLLPSSSLSFPSSFFPPQPQPQHQENQRRGDDKTLKGRHSLPRTTDGPTHLTWTYPRTYNSIFNIALYIYVCVRMRVSTCVYIPIDSFSHTHPATHTPTYIHTEIIHIGRAVRRLYNVGGGGAPPVPKKSTAAARCNRFYAQQTAKSQSHTHIIIVMLQCFMHFNAKRSFSLNLIALITLHSQCDWLLHYISQYSMVDGEISYTL